MILIFIEDNIKKDIAASISIKVVSIALGHELNTKVHSYTSIVNQILEHCCISGIAILLFASFVYFAEKDYLAPDIRWILLNVLQDTNFEIMQ